MKKSLLLLLMLISMLTISSFTTTGDVQLLENKQTHLVTGKVTACAGGAEIPGAAVLIYESDGGTVTDINGNYSIIVANDASLEVSYLGMRTVRIYVGNLSTTNICLEEEF